VRRSASAGWLQTRAATARPGQSHSIAGWTGRKGTGGCRLRRHWSGARALAGLIGGEAYQSGGNIWVILYPRKDGKFIVVGLDGADIYDSAAHYERYYDGDWPEPEFVYWVDSATRA